MTFLLKITVLSAFFLVFFMTFSFARLEMTEVMYAPLDENEWVEIFNNGNTDVNLALWKFRDNKEEDNLTCCSFLQKCSLLLGPQKIAVITDQDSTFLLSNFSTKNISSDNSSLQLCVSDTNLGNGLGNDGDNLTISNRTAEDIFFYTKSMGAYRNNHTLEKVSSGWRESLLPLGTPGKRNEAPQQDISPPTPPSPEIPSPPQNNQTSTSPNSTSQNSTSPAFISCDIALDLFLENPLFHSEKISFSLIAKNNTSLSTNLSDVSVLFSIRGNIATPEGKIVKEYSPWTNDRFSGKLEKAYAPSLSAGVYLLSFWLVNSSCNDRDTSNNLVDRLIMVMGSSSSSSEQERTDSLVRIEDISAGKDMVAKWGESIPVKISIYRGNTSKTLVELKAKKSGKWVSETSKVYLSEKFSSHEISIPLQLRCASGDGEITAVLDGLGVEAEKTFTVKDSAKRCEESVSHDQEELQTEEQNISSENLAMTENTSKFNFTFEELPETATAGEIFSVKIRIKNDVQEHTYRIWAYLYRGNTCYSCAKGTLERNASMQDFFLISEERKSVGFLLPLDASAEAGEYKVKVKLLKDELKTPKELTGDIILVGGEKQEKKEKKKNILAGASVFDSGEAGKLIPEKRDFSAKRKEAVAGSKGFTVYQSPDAKTIELVPIFLAIAFGLVIVVIVLRK